MNFSNDCVPCFAAALASFGLASALAQPQLNRTALVSRTPSGAPGNSQSDGPRITPDGRWMLFKSSASDLVPSDTNGGSDLFLVDLTNGQITRENVQANGSQIPSGLLLYAISSDGRFVTYSSAAAVVNPDGNNRRDVFVRDRQTGQVTRESNTPAGTPGDGDSDVVWISTDGRFVLFTSTASDLVANDGNAATDTFLRDRQAATTTCLSTNAAGVPAGGMGLISDDMRRLALWTSATLLPNDTNFLSDVYLFDLVSGERRYVSSTPAGQASNQSSFLKALSADGSVIVFESAASNLVSGDISGTNDVFVYDVTSGANRRLLIGPGMAAPLSPYYSVSANGRCLVVSGADGLVPGDHNLRRDAILIDLQTDEAVVRSVGWNGTPITHDIVFEHSVSADGRFLSYSCAAANIAPDDNNNHIDVFVSDVWPPPLVYCSSKVNSLGCAAIISWSGALSASSGTQFVLSASNVLNQKPGLLAYSLSGRAAIPFQGGLLCVQPPIRRTSILQSGGSTAADSDCSGRFEFDFAQLVASGSDPLLLPGQAVWATFWSRDPGFAFPDNSNLTAALEFLVLP